MPLAQVWDMFYSNAMFVAYHATGIPADQKLFLRVLLEWGVKRTPALKRFLFRVAHRYSVGHMVMPPALQQQLLVQAGTTVTKQELVEAVKKCPVG
jgi:hypothetical protein